MTRIREEEEVCIVLVMKRYNLWRDRNMYYYYYYYAEDLSLKRPCEMPRVVAPPTVTASMFHNHTEAPMQQGTVQF